MSIFFIIKKIHAHVSSYSSLLGLQIVLKLSETNLVIKTKKNLKEVILFDNGFWIHVFIPMK